MVTDFRPLAAAEAANVKAGGGRTRRVEVDPAVLALAELTPGNGLAVKCLVQPIHSADAKCKYRGKLLRQAKKAELNVRSTHVAGAIHIVRLDGVPRKRGPNKQ